MAFDDSGDGDSHAVIEGWSGPSPFLLMVAFSVFRAISIYKVTKIYQVCRSTGKYMWITLWQAIAKGSTLTQKSKTTFQIASDKW